jgi:hypothetical protein
MINSLSRHHRHPSLASESMFFAGILPKPRRGRYVSHFPLFMTPFAIWFTVGLWWLASPDRCKYDCGKRPDGLGQV